MLAFLGGILQDQQTVLKANSMSTPCLQPKGKIFAQKKQLQAYIQEQSSSNIIICIFSSSIILQTQKIATTIVSRRSYSSHLSQAQEPVCTSTKI
jgi:hypothetical protein